MNNLTLRQKINQMFILGFDGDDIFTSLNSGFVEVLKNGLGGVIFFTKNITSVEQVKRVTNEINNISMVKPFLSIDQEGGRVERTENIHGGKKYFSARDVAIKGNKFVQDQAESIAIELASYGLNMNFAPVLDVDTNPNNPIIAERSYSSFPDEVIRNGEIVASSFIASGIVPVCKHFPGHGETSVDSHLQMPELNLSLLELENTHIKPFEFLLEKLPAVMVAHIHYKAFDEEPVPASISSNIINGYLRSKLGFDGVVISDDMVMGGIKGFSSLEACKRGINAGVNMFIFRHSDEQTLQLIDSIEKMVVAGEIKECDIDKSVSLILKLKQQFSII